MMGRCEVFMAGMKLVKRSRIAGIEGSLPHVLRQLLANPEGSRA
jgi:hypothetical protein